ncbi:MAG TPA: DUF1566 domain-containing protein [Desulfurivibrionaceae bacterium]|nr:DUF1566 domain-containing protein [Desulfurivibrionaceae bacterium]
MRHTLFATLLLTLLASLAGPVQAETKPAFIKLDATGRELPDQAEEWVMVLDQATGLTWEIKSADGSLHDRDISYSWKNITETFLKGLNEEKFGGFADWRLPEDKELEILQKLNESDQELFARYFPRTAPSPYWTWSRCQDGNPNSTQLKFGPEPSPQKRQHRIRAVRGVLKE